MKSLFTLLLLAALWSGLGLASSALAEPSPPPLPSRSIPLNHLGAEVQKQCHGDLVSVTARSGGAWLRAAFQKIEGDATFQGLWLESTEASPKTDRFRVIAGGVRRGGGPVHHLAKTGQVVVGENQARFLRPGLIEEYRVSVDGVRQDFILPERMAGDGKLSIVLDVAGADVTDAESGLKLILRKSGREIAYSHLHVTDATGRELVSCMNAGGVERPNQIHIHVEDADAVYPIRVDPTFSDADWESLGEVLGVDNSVTAMATDSSGMIYIAGEFGTAGKTEARYLAKWDGNTWSNLGKPLEFPVQALACIGTDLYVASYFSGENGQSYSIGKWNGSEWSPVGNGSRIVGAARAMAVSGSNLFVGGLFESIGGVRASNVAKWDGNAWTTLGAGVSGRVRAMTMAGTDLYVAGDFLMAGEVQASHVAKWDGLAWSALGVGTNGPIYAIVASEVDVYIGGGFTLAGGVSAANVAKWNGSVWSALGAGMSNEVRCLAIGGAALYAGGTFDWAGGIPIKALAKWDGVRWSALGSGFPSDSIVNAMTMLGTDLYVGGLSPWQVQLWPIT